jgi:hypothetical protein
MFKDRFSKSINVITLILAGGILIFKGAQEKIPLSNLVWLALIYFYFMSLVIYFISKSGLKKDNKTFITRIYSSIGIRFIFSLSPLLIYLFFSSTKELSFIISYLLLYFFYTAFEIYFLVVNLRPDLNK